MQQRALFKKLEATRAYKRARNPCKVVAVTCKDVRKGRYLCRRWGRNTPQSQSERNNKRKRGQFKQRSDCL